MPTIDDLPAATAAADTDVLPTSQAGTARKVTRAQLLAGVQPAFALPPQTLVGRASPGTGAAETVAVGAHLTLAGGVLSADAGAFSVAALPNGSVPQAADLVPLSQAATNVSVPFATFAAGFSGLSGFDASRFVVTPTGSTAGSKLQDLFANVLPKTGGLVLGPLLLQSDPVLPGQAASKRYVDAQSAAHVARAGDAMTGTLSFQNAATGATGTLAAGGMNLFQFGGASTLLPCLSINTAGSSGAQTLPGGIFSQFEVTHAGGTPGYVIDNAWFSTQVINATNPDGTLADGPATNHWSVHALLYSRATESRSAGAANASGSQHGALLAQYVRELPAATGFPSGRVGAPGWAMSLECRDFTGQPSSIGGAFTGIELDMSAAGPDDANQRFGLQFNLSADAAPRGTGFCEFGRFLYVNAYNSPGNQCWFRSQLELFAPYTVAAIDLSQGTQDIANPITAAPNSAVAIKLRAGMKYGLNGDGITGQYLTYNATLARTELWSHGFLRAAFPDAGGMVMPGLPRAAAGLASGSLWNNAGVVNITP